MVPLPDTLIPANGLSRKNTLGRRDKERAGALEMRKYGRERKPWCQSLSMPSGKGMEAKARDAARTFSYNTVPGLSQEVRGLLIMLTAAFT